jgi:hypothetical protein
VSELALSVSPNHLHTLLLHLDDWIDANSPYNEWFLFLRRSHLETLCVTDQEKLAYCDSYPAIKKDPNGKEKKDPTSNKLLTAAELKDMERKMNRNEIISLRCFAMREVWRIPKGSTEFSDYLKKSGCSINDVADPLEDNPEEILLPFEQQYPSPLHALVTLLRWRNALLSLLKIKYVARKLIIDFPPDVNEFGAMKEASKRSVPSSLTSTGVYFALLKSDSLLQVLNPIHLESPLPALKAEFNIEKVEWEVIILDFHHDKLPSFMNGEPVGIMYKVRRNTHDLLL